MIYSEILILIVSISILLQSFIFILCVFYFTELELLWWNQKFRSDGVKKSIKEEALESLKAMTPAASLEADANSPPSVAQTLLGGISAGVIALILYKFTTTVEASLNRQTLSDNFSVCFSVTFLFPNFLNLSYVQLIYVLVCCHI